MHWPIYKTLLQMFQVDAKTGISTEHLQNKLNQYTF